MISGGITAERSTRSSGNPYLFIVGCPRSGTTLLQRMVDAIPLIAMTPEPHWVARWYNRKDLTSGGCVPPALVSKLLAYHRFPLLQISPERVERLIESGEPVSYSDFVTGIYNLYGSMQGKPLVGDKTPDYVRRIPVLHDLWPRARFVHIIRDGRDVCLSSMSWHKVVHGAGSFGIWAEDPVCTLALWWEWNIQLGREAGGSLGSDLYYEIRYEALVADPEGECRKLCAFLHVPYDEAMLRFHEGRTRLEPGLSRKDAWLPITPGLRDWRTQMAAADQERFEAAAGDLLDALAYPRAVPNVPAAALEHAARMRSSFTQDAPYSVGAQHEE